MKTLVVNRNVIMSIFTVMLLTYSVPGISYGQLDAPAVTPGETNTSLVVSFQITLDEEVDKNAYQIQLRQKTPQGEGISKCVVIESGSRSEIAGDLGISASAVWISGSSHCVLWVCNSTPGYYSDKIFNIRAILTDLEPGTTYEVRYRDTNLPECDQNPPNPGPWYEVGEGTTHLVAPLRADFADANLAKAVRNALELDTTGGHIDLLKIPQASLAKLTKLSVKDKEITNLTGLEQATQLTELDLSSNKISDITPLAQLTQLTLLNLWNNLIEDTSLLRQLLRENPKLDISTDILIVVTEPGGSADLYFTGDESIHRLSSDGTHRQNIVPRLRGPTGIALDVVAGKIYWAEWWDNKIQRSNLDGTNIQDIITRYRDPGPIALDTARNKIYWAGDHGIQRSNLDGTDIQDIVTGLENPADIALDIAGGKIYWSEKRLVYDPPGWSDDEYTHRIRRANLDGTNVQSIVVGVAGLSHVRGIALTTSTGGNEFSSTTPETSATTDTAVSISPASVVSPAIGQQIEFNLNITDGEAIAGYQATVQFDTTALRYILSSNGDFLPAGAFFVEPKVEGNLIKLSAASLVGESNGDGTLTILTFEVIAAKASTLTLSDVLLTNSAGEVFVPTVENAEITEATQLKGDINGDGIINIQDLVLTASNLGKTGQNPADVNGDGSVNIQDLILVAGALGTSAAAPSLHPQVLEMLTATEIKQWLSAAQHLDLTNATAQRGILFLQQLLITLTPKETALLPNYPNPFNPETWIPYHLAKDADVTLHIYAVNGTLVRTLTLGHQAAGLYQSRSRAAYWDGKNAFGESVASGVYFYTLTAGDFTATRKMLIRK